MNAWVRNYLFSLSALKAAVLFVSTLAVLSIALSSGFNKHPDEIMHADAFQYFEGKWRPPDLGSDDIKYSNNGVSRVYSGEIVYVIYGNLSYLAQKIAHIDSSYLIYRLLNVLLYFITLALLLFSKSRILKPYYIGFIFCSIPQISYIYSYANSDAWALSLGIFLFMFVLKKNDSPLFNWPAGHLIILGMLTGLLLASKRNFYLSLFLPYLLIIYFIRPSRKTYEWNTSLFRRLFFAFLLPALLMAVPLKIIYPLSQTHYQEKRKAMIEEKAQEGFKPSNPSSPGKSLSKKGYTYFSMLKEKDWFTLTFQSAWGLYGCMDVFNSRRIYLLALLYTLGLMALTAHDFFFSVHPFHNIFRTCLISSCLVMAFNIYFSLSYSLNIDYQPQGRYLFPSFIPMSLWLAGNTFQEGITTRVRRLVLICGYVIGLYSLLAICLVTLKGP